MYWSFPMDVVASARAVISSKCSPSQALKSRAARASSKMNTGARCIASSETVHFTPPERLSTFIPRL